MPGQLNILKETFNNLAGEMAAKFLPVITGFVNWVNAHWSEISRTIDAVFSAVSFAVTNVLRPAIERATAFVTTVVETVRAHWPEISRITQEVFGRVREIIQTITTVALGIWDRFG